MGNPDGPPPPHVVAEAGRRSLNNPRVPRLLDLARHPRASPGARLPATTSAASAWRSIRRMRSLVTLGSKEGLANLAQAIAGAGRRGGGAGPLLSDPPPSARSLPVPDPALGADQRGHRPVRSGLEQRDAPGAEAALLVVGVVNFPAQPDRAHRRARLSTSCLSFLELHTITVVSDVAYAEIYFDGKPPPSILQVPWAPRILRSSSPHPV